jgi:hypothetical protein
MAIAKRGSDPVSSRSPSKAPRAAQQARRWLTVVSYQIQCELSSRDFWIRLALILLQVSSIVVPIFRAGIQTGIASLGLFFLSWFVRSWRDGRRPNIKMFERNAAERSATLYRVVTALQRREEMTADEVATYQRDVLRYIAQFVRDHRRNSGIPTIFANLLVVDGEDLVVVARDREHRVTMARYPKRPMLAWVSLETGLVQLTGDLRRDYPETAVGKPYVSILVIPLFYKGERVGVVSIDSSSRYHFDLDWRELVDHLAPYVAMLGWTVPRTSPTLQRAESSVRELPS